MKKIFAVLSLALVFAGVAHAEDYFNAEGKKVNPPTNTLFGGQPRITFEYEHEKNTDAYGSTPNTAVSIFPGIQWKGNARPLGFITRAELMLEGNQDHGKLGNSGTGNTTETKMGVRLRSDGEIAGRWGYYVRGLVGQSWNNEQNFTYWYIEPALKTDLGDVAKGLSWTTSYRVVRTFNRSEEYKSADRNKIRFGPNYDFDSKNGVELRYVLATDPNNDDKLRSRAFVAEYVHKF